MLDTNSVVDTPPFCDQERPLFSRRAPGLWPESCLKPGNSQLPAPNMLMMDRIPKISHTGGLFDKGEIIAELDITRISGFSTVTSLAIQ